MKRLGTSKLLGLALGPASLQAAEIVAAGPAWKLARVAEFRFPQGLSLDTPAELGKALRAFLNQHGFSARDAAIGLPAKWLATRRKDVPPAAAGVALDMLRLLAETEFAGETEFVVDVAGSAHADRPATVLLTATSRKHVEQCEALARAAELRLKNLTATALALRAAADASDDGLQVHIAGTSAEVLAWQQGSPVQLRHVALPENAAEAAGILAGELRRVQAGLAGRVTALTLADTAETPPAWAEVLGEKAGLAVRPPAVPGVAAAPADVARQAAAVAVAWSATASGGVDFLHSRLAPPSEQASRRPLFWAAAVAATVLLAIVIGALDLRQQQAIIDDSRARLKNMSKQVDEAKTAANRLTAVRNWTTRKPVLTACLRDLTGLFPDENTLWATSLDLRGDLGGQLSGKASSEQQVLMLLDRLKDSKRFADPKLLDMREATRNGREIAFSISFTFVVPAEGL